MKGGKSRSAQMNPTLQSISNYQEIKPKLLLLIVAYILILPVERIVWDYVHEIMYKMKTYWVHLSVQIKFHLKMTGLVFHEKASVGYAS